MFAVTQSAGTAPADLTDEQQATLQNKEDLLVTAIRTALEVCLAELPVEALGETRITTRGKALRAP